VAVGLRLHNAGDEALTEDVAAEALLSDEAGQSFHTAGFPTIAGEAFPHGEVDLEPGETESGVVTFVVPDDATGLQLRLTLASGFSSPVAEWRLQNPANR
jgi:hypothetical protein